ncbi:hypothetical protein F4604DRAFT_1684234 [Suillus subluteus]|nr:hypothetical protein F4604DRAFT_1684234 [Suillus subluteus]
MANSDNETADAKSRVMHEAGFVVPSTFEELPAALKSTYEALVTQGVVVPAKEVEPPELGLIRNPAAFISTIVDKTCSNTIWTCVSLMSSEKIFVLDVSPPLWFKRHLSPWATKFIKMVLMLTAYHCPAISGAMNTIVATRASRDLISSLASGLLTIGSRFSGALDDVKNSDAHGPGF